MEIQRSRVVKPVETKLAAMRRGTRLLQFLDRSLGMGVTARLRGAVYHLDRWSPAINASFFLNGSAVDTLTADPSFKANQTLSYARIEDNSHDYLTI
jgi:hypothetical protein